MADALLTQRETEILQHAWHCFQSPDALKIDIEKLAKRCGMSNPKSAANAWAGIKKKLASAQGDDTAATNGDTTMTPKGTPVKGTPKKRAPAKAKAKTPEETEGGDLADTEKTPGAVSPSAKKGGRKRKAAEIADTISSPIKAEDDIGVNDNGETAATETPEKKKRVYNRKPKGDVNTAIAKPGKKQSKATQQALADTKAAVAAANAHHDAMMASIEDPNISMFGGDSQMEEADEEGRTFDEEEQRIVNEQLSTLVKGGETAV